MPTPIRSIDETVLTDLISWLSFHTGQGTITWAGSVFDESFVYSTANSSIAIGPKVQNTCKLRVYDGRGDVTQIDVPVRLMPTLCDLYDMVEATVFPIAVVKTVQTTIDYLKGLQPK